MINNINNSSKGRKSANPGKSSGLFSHRKYSLKRKIILAALPTITVIAVFAFINIIGQQQLLFASLAASAFLIYLDPRHTVNNIRTLIISQMLASVIGLISYLILGPGFYSGGVAMVITIILMITFDIVHPPAVATSLIFALRAGKVSDLVLFLLAVGITVLLVILERFAIWMLDRYERKDSR